MSSDFKKFGTNNQIYPMAKFANPEAIEIGSDCKIDDFTFFVGGQGIKIGNHVHFGSFSCVIGGGQIEIGNYVGISQHVEFATGSHDYKLKGRLTAACPIEEQAVYRGKIVIENDVLILANSVICPNVRIGEGAVVGALSLVTKDVEPWSVVAGIPAKVIGKRKRLDSNERK